jgi:hypothetical protein
MSFRSHCGCTNFVCLLAILAITVTLQASPIARPLIDDPNAAELGLLRRAYSTLAVADHDYKGHRVKAMHSIEAACDILGSDIRGSGKGREKQAVSDAQLREAQGFVEQARNIAMNQAQAKIIGHLNKAANEISVALTIK